MLVSICCCEVGQLSMVLTLSGVSPKTWCKDISSTPTLVGRDQTADIRLKHRSISRAHCRFWMDGHECYVEDCGSTNGTYVNGERVEKRKLSSGDRVLVGHFELFVAQKSTIEETLHTTSQEETFLTFQDRASEERHLAAAVHELLTPSRRIAVPGLFVEVSYTPTGVLGGDCFQYEELDDHWALAVFDAMHHGTKSALMLTLIREQFQRWISLTTEPSKCLEWINAELIKLGHDELYISASIAIWSPVTQMLVYSTAGLHPPVLLRDGRRCQLPSTADGLPLGIRPNERYGEQLIDAQVRDRFFFFTDGVSDAVRAKHGGTSPSTIIAEHFLQSAGDRLSHQVRQLIGGLETQAYDDALLVGCEVQKGVGRK